MSTSPQSFGNQGIRLVKEATYGVLPGTPAWKRLNDVRMVPSPQFETDLFMPSGYEVPSVAVLNDDYTTFDVTGRLSYTSLMYILSSLFGPPVTTAVTGASGAHDHVWTWDGKTPIVPASYSVEYGIANSIRRVLGVVFNGFTAGVSRGGLDFSSAAFGKDLSLQTGTFAATDVAAKPMFPLHFDVYADNSWADAIAGTTKLLALYNYGLGLGERLDRSRPVNSSRSSDNIYVRDDQEHTVDLRMGTDSVSEGWYTNVRNGSMKFIRAHAKGGVITGTANFEFEAVTAILLAGNEGYDTENGIHVMTWNGRIARDDVSGNAAMFRLRNNIAAL